MVTRMYFPLSTMKASLRKEKNMSKYASEGCPVNEGCDKVSCWLSKVGVTRSLLITLGLLPFAWNGLALLANGVVGVWKFLTTSVGQ
jgi:hypothetical protein